MELLHTPLPGVQASLWPVLSPELSQKFAWPLHFVIQSWKSLSTTAPGDEGHLAFSSLGNEHRNI